MDEFRLDARHPGSALFTTRKSGYSRAPYDQLNLATHVGDEPGAVAANRRVVEERIGAPISWMEQVHGNNVAVLAAAPAEPVAGTDALVTATPGVALGVLVADCVPVVITAASVIAVAHAGRRGLVNGIARRTVETMTDMGTTPTELHVWMGPAICGGCYEVPVDMQHEAELAAPGCAVSTTKGTAGIDIRAGLLSQLLELGISEQLIHVSPACTAETAELYSHRRDGVTGRFAGIVTMPI